MKQTTASLLFPVLLFSLLAQPANLFAQKADSLLAAYKKLPNDTEKINTGLLLCRQLLKKSQNQEALDYCKEIQKFCEDAIAKNDPKNVRVYKRNYAASFNMEGNIFYFGSDYPGAIGCYNKALQLYEEINDAKGIGNATNNLGLMAYTQGNYTKAYDYYTKALKIREQINDEGGLSSSYNNLAMCLEHQGNYPGSLEYHFKALALNEKRGDKYGVSTSLTNIGAVYSNQKNYKKALEYYTRCLPILQEIGNKHGLGNVYNNLGICSQNDKKYAEAISYHQKALAIRQQIGDPNGIAASYNNLGELFYEQRNFSAALQYNLKALGIRKEIQDSLGIALSLFATGQCYAKLGDQQKALENCLQSYHMAQKMGEKRTIMGACEELSIIYAQLRDFEKAYTFQSRAVALGDSLANDESVKASVRAEMNYEFGKQQAIEKAEREKAAVRTEAYEHRQQLILWGVSAILGLVLIFAVFVYRSYLRKQKDHAEIVQQKHIIEEKQKEILSSIHYAKRIQKVLLPQEKVIDKTITRLKK